MKSNEIRSRFLEFFKKRGHVVIQSSPLVTSDEQSGESVTNKTLFNTAGMQPLVPYLLGKSHPSGKRLVNAQKCLRTIDIDDVGDNTHATFFEMLGNWSLGDYFKKEAISWSYQFLTSKEVETGEKGLGLDPKRLYITVFDGDENAPKDDEAAKIWSMIFKKNGIEGERIFYMPASSNWWEAGENGPCGPDSEMFYDVLNKFNGRGLTKDEYIKADNNRDVVEVWNDVFMQYEKKDGKIIGKLSKPSVDTGAGLERLAMVMQNVDNIYDTDLFGFSPLMKKMESFSSNWDIRAARIVADHVRAATFLISDGVRPSNTDRGYILRRLIRRAVRYADILGLEINMLSKLSHEIIGIYQNIYPELNRNSKEIKAVLDDEERKFRETTSKGFLELNRRLEKQGTITSKDVFDLYQTFGLPIELTTEVAKEKGIEIDLKNFEIEFKKHQEFSRSGAEQKFKGGLADANDPMVVRYHTATHLLHQALFDVLGKDIAQKGSNITPERLRFDFSYKEKMTDEQKKMVEEIVNKKIEEGLQVGKIILPIEEANKTGAKHFFGEKYGDQVSVYYIGDSLESAYSKEFCGGPHIKNTKELAGREGTWKFKIKKEEAISKGIRRIKAILI